MEQLLPRPARPPTSGRPWLVQLLPLAPAGGQGLPGPPTNLHRAPVPCLAAARPEPRSPPGQALAPTATDSLAAVAGLSSPGGISAGFCRGVSGQDWWQGGDRSPPQETMEWGAPYTDPSSNRWPPSPSPWSSAVVPKTPFPRVPVPSPPPPPRVGGPLRPTRRRGGTVPQEAAQIPSQPRSGRLLRSVPPTPEGAGGCTPRRPGSHRVDGVRGRAGRGGLGSGSGRVRRRRPAALGAGGPRSSRGGAASRQPWRGGRGVRSYGPGDSESSRVAGVAVAAETVAIVASGRS